MLGDSVAVYLDDGPAGVSYSEADVVETSSTIVDATDLAAGTGGLRILRHGVISEERIRALVPDAFAARWRSVPGRGRRETSRREVRCRAIRPPRRRRRRRRRPVRRLPPSRPIRRGRAGARRDRHHGLRREVSRGRGRGRGVRGRDRRPCRGRPDDGRHESAAPDRHSTPRSTAPVGRDPPPRARPGLGAGHLRGLARRHLQARHRFRLYPEDPRARRAHEAHAAARRAWRCSSASRASRLGVASQLPVASSVVFADPSRVFAILGAALIIVVIGVADDIWDLDWMTSSPARSSPRACSPGRACRSLAADRRPHRRLARMSLIITVLAIVLVMNAINFIDGLDGLVAGVALIANGVFFLYSYLLGAADGRRRTTSTSPSLIAAVARRGLRRLPAANWHPAKLFMGDAGALLVGLLMATSRRSRSPGRSTRPAIARPRRRCCRRSSRSSCRSPILIVPLLDFGLAVIRRLRAGKSPFSADRKHLHHRLLDMGHSHLHAVLIFYAWTAVVSVGCLLFFVRRLSGAALSVPRRRPHRLHRRSPSPRSVAARRSRRPPGRRADARSERRTPSSTRSTGHPRRPVCRSPTGRTLDPSATTHSPHQARKTHRDQPMPGRPTSPVRRPRSSGARSPAAASSPSSSRSSAGVVGGPRRRVPGRGRRPGRAGDGARVHRDHRRRASCSPTASPDASSSSSPSSASCSARWLAEVRRLPRARVVLRDQPLGRADGAVPQPDRGRRRVAGGRRRGRALRMRRDAVRLRRRASDGSAVSPSDGCVRGAAFLR